MQGDVYGGADILQSAGCRSSHDGEVGRRHNGYKYVRGSVGNGRCIARTIGSQDCRDVVERVSGSYRQGVGRLPTGEERVVRYQLRSTTRQCEALFMVSITSLMIQDDETNIFLGNIARELESRLIEANMRGKHIALKLMVGWVL